MENALARNWWAMLLRGVFAVLFGVATLVWPGLSLSVLVMLFGAYALVDGVFAIVSSLRRHDGSRRFWMLFVEGIFGIAAGLFTFAVPGITALALVVVIAVWAILTGVLEIMAAFRLRQQVPGEILLGLAGLVSIAWGVMLFVWPGAGALAMTWLIGWWAIFFGVMFFALGIRLHSMLPPSGRHRVPPTGTSVPA